MANPPTDREVLVALAERIEALRSRIDIRFSAHELGEAWQCTAPLLEAYRQAGEKKCVCDPHVEWCEVCDPKRRGVVVDEVALDRAWKVFHNLRPGLAVVDGWRATLRVAIRTYLTEQAKGAK